MRVNELKRINRLSTREIFVCVNISRFCENCPTYISKMYHPVEQSIYTKVFQTT